MMDAEIAILMRLLRRIGDALQLKDFACLAMTNLVCASSLRGRWWCFYV